MTIAKDLIPLKVINFVIQAGMACFVPYKALYQKELGLSPAQNGIIQSIEKALTLVAPPMIGGIADKFSSHKMALVACILASVIFTVPMYFIPTAVEGSKIAECCLVENAAFCSYNDQSFNLLCEVDNNVTNCTDATVSAEVQYSCTTDNSSTFFSRNCSTNVALQCEVLSDGTPSDIYGITFGLMLGLTVFYASAFSPIQPLIDATVMNTLGDRRMHNYGHQRLWGSIGFGLIAFVLGYLVDITPSKDGSSSNFLACFIGAALFGVLSTIVTHWLEVPTLKRPSLLSGTQMLLKNSHILLFLFVILVSGTLLGVKYAFVFWYAKSLPGSSQLILGLSILLGSATEIPAFFLSGWVSNKIGDDFILFIGLLIAAIRCFLYTVLTYGWQLLLVESLHGLSFAFPMAAMCSKAATLAPEGMTATLIGLTQGVYWGLGNMIGALLGGFLFNSLGAIAMFRIFAAFGGFVACLFTVIHLVTNFCGNTSAISAPRSETKNLATAVDEAIPLADIQDIA